MSVFGLQVQCIATLQVGSIQAGNASECGQCFSLSWMPCKPHHHLAAGFYDGESPTCIPQQSLWGTALALQQAEMHTELSAPSASAWGREWGTLRVRYRGSVIMSSSKWKALCRNLSACPWDRGMAYRGWAVGTLTYLVAPGRGSGLIHTWLTCLDVVLCLASGNPELCAVLPGPAVPQPSCPALSPSSSPGSATVPCSSSSPCLCHCLSPSPVLPWIPRCSTGCPLRCWCSCRAAAVAAPHGHGSPPAGTVAVWNLLTKSLLQCVRQPDGSLKLYPFRCFLAHDHAVRSIEWCKADR